jgi:hypothetical protein
VDVNAVRVALAAALADVPNLRAYSFVAPKIEPPAALVAVGSGFYDDDFDASMTARFGVMVLVARADDRSGQKSLDAYISSTGAQSIKAAVEADITLGGEVSSAKVVGWNDPQEYEIAGVSYLGVEFDVEALD